MSKHIVFSSGKIYRVVSDSMDPFCFRDLSDDEEMTFRKSARDMQDEPGGILINPTWHPSIQDELLTSGRGKEG